MSEVAEIEKEVVKKEREPLFSKKNLKVLLDEIKYLKNYSLTSFKEQNIVNLISYEGMFDLSYFKNDKILNQFLNSL